MPATITLTRPSFTDVDSLPSATFNGVTVVSATVPDAEAGAYGVVRLAGDLTGSAAGPVLVATGATAGSYGVAVLAIPQLTVDAKGRVTAVADRPLGTAYGKSVIESANAAGARAVLVLGDVATRNVGTTTGTAAAGDDSRFTNSRRCNGTFDDAAAARTALALGDVATRNVGTTPGTAAAGDDARLSNSRQCNNAFDNAATARTALGIGPLAVCTEFISAQQDIPASAVDLVVAHGKGVAPKFYRVGYICVIADNGFAVGDEIGVFSDGGYADGATTTWVNATGIGYRRNGTTPIASRSTTWFSPTSPNWKLVMRAWF